MSSFIHHKIPFSKSNNSIIVLAAGASRRLGAPKQLLNFGGKPLILHVLREALFAKCQSVFLVLGANADLILPKVQHLPIEIVKNNDWEKGMGTSISCGIKALQKKHPSAEGAVLMLSDQPFVSDHLIQKIVQQAQNNNFDIVASQYDESLGVPAFFSKKNFNELEKLSGTEGAKKVILNHLSEVGFVPFLEGSFDIDTKEDYERLLNWEKTKPII